MLVPTTMLSSSGVGSHPLIQQGRLFVASAQGKRKANPLGQAHLPWSERNSTPSPPKELCAYICVGVYIYTNAFYTHNYTRYGGLCTGLYGSFWGTSDFPLGAVGFLANQRKGSVPLVSFPDEFFARGMLPGVIRSDRIYYL